ncbi:MAG TPA: flavoprotein [Gemmataceae bacterium]|nr:flavoprotein [Gemmataceae bacterium]
MANVLLGATGSVAAVRVPDLYRQLRLAEHAVKVVATRAALYFFDPVTLNPERPERDPDIVILDEDEWPGRDAGQLWQRDDPVLHIELRKWADLLVIAPLDANTLAKLANGLSDNCLTCVWRAWDTARPVVLAPAMNTLMWLHPLTGRHLRQLAADSGGGDVPAGLDLDAVMAWINERCPRLWVVGPQSKRLACGDVGVGAMADVAEVVAAITAALPLAA